MNLGVLDKVGNTGNENLDIESNISDHNGYFTFKFENQLMTWKSSRFCKNVRQIGKKEMGTQFFCRKLFLQNTKLTNTKALGYMYIFMNVTCSLVELMHSTCTI